MNSIKSILLTNSGINKTSGGGVVSYNLLQTLREVSDVRLILSDQHFKDGLYEGIVAQCIEPSQFGYNDPFFMDYMARAMIPDEPIDLAVTYGCPFNLAMDKLKKENITKIVCDLAPHNIDISREEHLRVAGSYPYIQLNNEFLLNLYLNHLRIADKVVVHSHKSATYIMQTAKLKELPTVIPHGCYAPSEKEILPYPDTFTPGYFGAIGIDKGITYMISAWVHCNLPEKYQLWIGGAGTERFNVEEKYKHFFNVVGAVNSISNFFNNISVYVQPSIQDGFGITPLEAMSYKRPVIVSDGAGVSELVTDGLDGFVVPARDIGAIKDKIMYFYEHPGEIQRMGENARNTALDYTWSNVREQYIKLYKDLL